jgi:hypothetical protein
MSESVSEGSTIPISSSVSAYNSDKVQLQKSITKVYEDIKDQTKDTTQYKDIENESFRLYNRQQAIYHMVATLALISVMVTVHRLT